MNIYLLTQIETVGYDTYDSMVVITTSELAARHMHPEESINFDRYNCWDSSWPAWATKPGNVTVELLGKAEETSEVKRAEQIVLTSFNAG